MIVFHLSIKQYFINTVQYCYTSLANKPATLDKLLPLFVAMRYVATAENPTFGEKMVSCKS